MKLRASLSCAALIFGVLTVALAALGSPPTLVLQTATVKIISAARDGSLELRGSGLAFAHSGHAYVLTSDHVVLHDNFNRKHVVQFENGATATCDFVVSDFGRGLALLEITGPFDPAVVTELTSIVGAAPAAADRVIVMGYPAMSNGLVRDPRGAISNPRAPSMTLVQTKEMIEIVGAHGEFGMSGGVVTSTDDRFIGVLSHQIYSETPDRISNKILVVPSDVALPWAKAAIEAPRGQEPIQFGQSTSQQMWKDSLTMGTRHLAFWWGDFFGTGREIGSIRYVTPEISAELPGGTMSSLLPIEEDLQASHCNAYLMGFRQREPFGASVAMPREPIGQLRLFLDTKLEPFVQLWCNETYDLVDTLDDHANVLRKLESRLRGTPKLAARLSRVIDHIEGHQSGDPRNYHFFWLKRGDLDWLLTSPEFRAEWAILAKSGDEAALRTELTQLRAIYVFLSE